MRDISVVASHTSPTGDLAPNPSKCPDWESNQQPLGSQASAQSTEPHQPGLREFIFVFNLHKFPLKDFVCINLPCNYYIFLNSSQLIVLKLRYNVVKKYFLNFQLFFQNDSLTFIAPRLQHNFSRGTMKFMFFQIFKSSRKNEKD